MKNNNNNLINSIGKANAMTAKFFYIKFPTYAFIIKLVTKTKLNIHSNNDDQFHWIGPSLICEVLFLAVEFHRMLLFFYNTSCSIPFHQPYFISVQCCDLCSKCQFWYFTSIYSDFPFIHQSFFQKRWQVLDRNINWNFQKWYNFFIIL